MTRQRSSIPHLARAIYEKRCTQRSVFSAHRINFLEETLPATKEIKSFRLRTVRLASTNLPKSRNSDIYNSQRIASKNERPVQRERDNRRSNLQSASRIPSSPQYPKPRVADDAHTDGAPLYNASKDPSHIRRTLYIICAGAVFMGAWVTYTLVSAVQDAKQYKLNDDQLQQDEDVSDRWNRKDRNYDAEVDAAEKFMLMRPKRKRLIREAYGDVLEVSVGTGRNMDLYDTRPYSKGEDSRFGRGREHMITSLTFNDQSAVMIENAKRKWDAKQMEKRKHDRFTGVVRWIVGDAGTADVVQRPPGGFDTIIQSYGICSMKQPVKFLQQLGHLVRQPGERIQNAATTQLQKESDNDGRGGRIFLLEHGKGHYSWLNQFLDNLAAPHADRFGCWFNKDIAKVVEDSGLIVERVRRYHGGTTWEIVLRPAPVPASIIEVSKEEDTQTTNSRSSNAWWKLWR